MAIAEIAIVQKNWEVEMDRLTERDEFGNADIIGVDSGYLQLNLEFDEMNRVTMALNKLAEYEDKVESGELVKVVRCGECKDFWQRKCINSDSGYFEWNRVSNDYCDCGERSVDNV